jgi:DNA polymerase III subunit delta
MPSSTPQAVRKQIAQGTLDPLYLIVGDDEAEMSQLAADLAAVVEDELRAFNFERLYAGEKAGSPEAIVQAARTLPMMGDRRVIVVLRAEKIFKPKRRGKGEEDESSEEGDAPADLDVLEAYVRSPEPMTTVVFVAADVDRVRRLYKAVQKTATIVECWGLKRGKDTKGLDLQQVGRQAEALVKQAVTAAGKQIDPNASRLIAARAGTDIGVLRGDLERLLLYAADKATIGLEDVQAVVTAETSQDDWAVTNAIERGDTAVALRQLALALESGGVPYMILGQLGWFVREKLVTFDPRRVRPAVEAVFRTDLELKSSGGDPRILLERLVVDLCRRHA